VGKSPPVDTCFFLGMNALDPVEKAEDNPTDGVLLIAESLESAV